ncbi:MAG: TonB-dependent receptor [Pirellulaceae bacterium]|nr:TonB-dependent receptor [Pirellulaceae bacterium]
MQRFQDTSRLVPWHAGLLPVFFSLFVALNVMPLSSGWCQDEPPIVELPETVVPGRPSPFPANPLSTGTLLTPNRSETDANRVGSSYTVINEAEITQTRQSSVAEVLRGKLGLDVVRSGGSGGATSIFLRGANSQHTKVLMDGIPINDPSHPNRGFDFSSLSADNIERIEVLRGPQSILYGSDALGGVINIITKRGEGPPTIRASGMGGSFGTARTSLSISGGDQASYYSVSGGYSHTDGISAASVLNGNTEPDRHRNGNLSGRLGWNLSENLNVDYVFRYIDRDVEIDSYDFTTGFTDDLLRANLSQQFMNRIQLRSLGLDGLVENRIGFSQTDYQRQDTAVLFPAFEPADFHGQTRQADWQSNLVVTESQLVTVGVDYLHESASSNLNPHQQQYNTGVYLQDQVTLTDHWFASVGFRWDDHSAAGNASTYRISTRYLPPGTGREFHGSIGTGFRAPALAENFFTGGNPALLPETSRGWDIGMQQSFLEGVIVLDATCFRNDFRNLINYDFVTNTLQNIGQARATGVEVSGTCILTQQSILSANYTCTDTKDLQFGGKLARRPHHKAGLTYRRQSLDERTGVNATLLIVGDRLDLPQRYGGTVLDNYLLLNLAGSYQLNPQWELFGRIDNVTNEQYVEALGFGTPGIAGYAGLNVTW